MENFATLWFLASVDAASLCWCFNLNINSTKFINTYLRPMVTHYKNQGQEKWDSCRDTCNLSQILQLPGNNSRWCTRSWFFCSLVGVTFGTLMNSHNAVWVQFWAKTLWVHGLLHNPSVSVMNMLNHMCHVTKSHDIHDSCLILSYYL